MAEMKSSAQGSTTTSPSWVSQQDASLAAAGVAAAYASYTGGTLPAMSGALQNYTLAGVICVGELASAVKQQQVVALNPETREPRADVPAVNPVGAPPPPVVTAGPVASTGAGCSTGYTQFGFVAVSKQDGINLVVLRGTATDEEAYYDISSWGTNVACSLPTSSSSPQNYGPVNAGLWKFYAGTSLVFWTSMAKSCLTAIQAAATQNPKARWIFTGHSLGGAMITLAAMDSSLAGLLSGTPSVYTFGSLHVGDQTFVNAYNQQCPNTIRFANLCDFVPSMVSLYPATWQDPYEHVGLESTFIWQWWDDWANHSMLNVYQVIIDNNWNLLYWGPRSYPQ